MQTDKLNNLQIKANKEFDDYKKQLISKSKSEIIEYSYETAIKEEMSFIGCYNISDELVDILLTEENTLDFLYQEYLERDGANISNEIGFVFEQLELSINNN